VTLSPASSADEIVRHLKTLRNEVNIAGMARYGIETSTALGVTTPQIRAITRQVKRNHARALRLWQTGLRDARMTAILTADPEQLTKAEAQAWAAGFSSWEVVDTAAVLFAIVPFWQELIDEFSADDREYVRRTAFAMIAAASVHRKQEPDATLIACLPLIETHAGDQRNFVRKAVDWALRNVGKRSRACHGPALALAERLAAGDDRTARWIGRNAVRELTCEKVLARLG
jgi:3-methyladenine DNA glycosylase AlkD